MSKRVENQKRGYRTASEYAAQAAARIQINENGYIDINKVVQENNELRHKVVYLGSRCEQVEAELVQTKDYLQSEISKAKAETTKVEEDKSQSKAKIAQLETRIAALDLELIEARERSEDLEAELRTVRQLQVQRYREFLNPLNTAGSSDEEESWSDTSLLPRETTII